MKNKALALILIIPLVLIFCVFSAVNIATLKVPISVSGVSIFHAQEEIVNLADGNTFQINAQVLPRNASNPGLLYSFEEISGKPLANIQIDQNGLVTASGYGSAKITVTTKDGAYKQSFILQVTSSLASNVHLSLDAKQNIMVGDNFLAVAEVTPAEALDKNVVFSSSNLKIVKINALTGECIALSSGTATLRAVLENGLNGRIEKSLEVVVLPTASDNPLTINGVQTFTDKIFTENFSAILEVNFSKYYALGETIDLSDIILEYQNQGEEVELEEISHTNGIYKYNLNIFGLMSEAFDLKVKINKDYLTDFFATISLQKVVDLNDVELLFANFKQYIKLNATNSFTLSVLPADFLGYEINAHYSQDNITLQKVGNTYYCKGTKIGKNTLYVDILVDGEVIKTFAKEQEVLNPPTSLNFVDNTINYGIEDMLTVASHKMQDGQEVENKRALEFIANTNLEYIEFATSNAEIAKVQNGCLTILSEGIVTITATELQSKLLGETLNCQITLRCVLGVEVDTYENLVLATELGRQVVLTNNIDLGEKLIEVNDDGTTTLLKSYSECEKILKSEVKQMETSYEWNYYKNLGATTPPTINYIIKFTNNCYGNGFTLNANNITNALDGTGALYSFAVFKGPLDLVAIPDASVKAQDNICFIATDNVMLNNVELVGANLNGSESTDLTKLNYSGTVLEVMGDNVKIVNSRIRNGRNCVRVYGKEYGNDEKINVLIESCVISNAREFLIKVGTNQKLYGEFTDRDKVNMANGVGSSVWDECAPKLQGFEHLNDGNLSLEQYNQRVSSYLNNQDFMALVKTNLTIKNCVLHTSGLFSIGIETSFAGPALDGGKWNNWNFTDYGWASIAGTSYPCILNLEGSVKMYDWKNISNIDSSTLIEGGMFNFSISDMINSLYSSGELTSIITELDGQKYAHGGIVMYGGGKNYSIVNNNSEESEGFENFTLSLDSVKSNLTSMLKYASGKEPFRMFMYGKTSYFNYYKQLADMQSGEAYSALRKYVG